MSNFEKTILLASLKRIIMPKNTNKNLENSPILEDLVGDWNLVNVFIIVEPRFLAKLILQKPILMSLNIPKKE